MCIKTDWSKKTVQTQIRLLLKGQSDQGLHCLSFAHPTALKIHTFNFYDSFKVFQLLEILRYSTTVSI